MPFNRPCGCQYEYPANMSMREGVISGAFPLAAVFSCACAPAAAVMIAAIAQTTAAFFILILISDSMDFISEDFISGDVFAGIPQRQGAIVRLSGGVTRLKKSQLRFPREIRRPARLSSRY